MIHFAIWLLVLAPGATNQGEPTPQTPAVLATEASRTDWGLAESTRQMLLRRCGDCHTPASTDRKARRALLDVGDLAGMVDEFVTPGDPELSDLYTVIVDGDMPPSKSDVAAPSAQELALLEAWILSGAEPPRTAADTPRVVSAPEPETWKRFVSRSHPIWIHFPLGLLPIALLAAILSLWKRSPHLQTTARFCVALAFPTALIAVASGWLHAAEGLATTEIELHRWTGVATAILCGLALVFRTRPRIFLVWLGLASALAAAAGHFGGRITYGQDFFPW